MSQEWLNNFLSTTKGKIVGIVLLISLGIGAIFLVTNLKQKSSSNEQPGSSANQSFPSANSREEFLSIGNIKNSGEIKKSFNSFVKENISHETVDTGIKGARIVNEKGDPVPLDNLINSLKINIPDDLQQYLSNNTYDLFYCPGKNKKKNVGLILYLGSRGNSTITPDVYPKVASTMKSWEKIMLRDLHELLFPEVTFSQNDLNQNLNFQDGKSRYAEISLPDGTKSSINYKSFGDPIIISTSLSCLNNAAAYFLETEDGTEE